MRRAKEKSNVTINIFANNSFTFNFSGESHIGAIIVGAIVIALISKLLAMPFSDTNELMQWISSFLSTLDC